MHNMIRPAFVVVLLSLLSGPGLWAGGPDVIVGDIFETKNWTPNSTGGAVDEGGILYRAYSLGTKSCNVGDQKLDWFEFGNQHPVIAQAMYRLHEGRFEQIGVSWLKHGYCALQQTLCGPCQPAGTGCVAQLGIGCSDPYFSDTNGDQTTLGPRFEVNPSTGEFLWPYSFKGLTGGKTYKRLKVKQDDLNVGLFPGALFFVEAMYVHPDDAVAGNNKNNASYRRVTVSTTTFNFTLQGTTALHQPAIQAWKDHGLGPGVPDPDVTLQAVDVTGDGRFWIGYKVSLNEDGRTYHYEYAIQNLSSDRAGGWFSVPAVDGAAIDAVGFHDNFYHSGEPFDPEDWVTTIGGGAVTWSSPTDFAEDPYGNALRFGTLYNYRFDSGRPPMMGAVTLGLYKPGAPDSVLIPALVPTAVLCLADLDGDGDTDQSDLGLLLGSYGKCPGDAGYVAQAGSLAQDNPCVTQADLGILLSNFGCN
jgi:hypothetical protein